MGTGPWTGDREESGRPASWAGNGSRNGERSFPSREPGSGGGPFQAVDWDKSHVEMAGEPDGVMGDMGAALSVALGGSCILGQYGPDQIVILFPRRLPGRS